MLAACDVPADVAGRTFSRFCCVLSDPAFIGCDSGDGEVRRFEASTEFLEVGAVFGRCCALVPGLFGEESCRACPSSVSVCIIKNHNWRRVNDESEGRAIIQHLRCVVEDVTDREGVTLKRGVKLTEAGLLAFAELPEDLLSLLPCR